MGSGGLDPLDDVVDAVRRGDRDAIAAVYLELGPGLRSFLRRRVPHGEIADDLVEQTFLELIEAHDRIRGDGRSLRAWVFRAARNNLYDWRKRADRRSDHELTPERTRRLVDEEPGPEPSALRRELDAEVLAALAQLTAVQREVLELRLVAELPVAEVAEITGRTVGATKTLQHRAVRALLRHLGGEP